MGVPRRVGINTSPVLHLNWTTGSLCAWAESPEAWETARTAHADGRDIAHLNGHTGGEDHRAGLALVEHETCLPHAFDADPDGIAAEIRSLVDMDPARELAELTLLLPVIGTLPEPSMRLRQVVDDFDEGAEPFGRSFRVRALRLQPEDALELLLRLSVAHQDVWNQLSSEVRFAADVSAFVVDLLSEQRFVPTLLQTDAGFEAGWQPWLHDQTARVRLHALLRTMPPAVRAVVDQADHQPWLVLDDMLRGLTDAFIRRVLIREHFSEAIEDADPEEDEAARWLSGLLTERTALGVSESRGAELLRAAREWLDTVESTGGDRPYRLALQLEEPLGSDLLPELAPVGEEITWRLSFHLQSTSDPDDRMPASEVWHPSAAAMRGRDSRQEILLGELGRAGRIYRRIEQSLEETEPTELELTTRQAHEFLREHGPVLAEAGFGIILPSWWNSAESQLGTRLIVNADSHSADGAAPDRHVSGSRLGLQTIVNYQWQVAVGERTISMEEFERLVRSRSPLVPIGGRWVEVRPEDLKTVSAFLEQHAVGTMTVAEAMRAAHGFGDHASGLPVFGVQAHGWVSDLLEASSTVTAVPELPQPRGFQGELRPYQRNGLNWLSFLDGLGLGGCLADDMGLGKTIQLIALLLHEREASESPPGPTLICAPMSVVSNWVRELERFSPTLVVHLHHGLDRPVGDAFLDVVRRTDVILTTYGLVARDIDLLRRVRWRRVVLDEAQYVKNPPTKQSQAIRSLDSERRIAITGTPVENRLSELWSIMEFCNPGYLGSMGEFRRRFALPIERHRNARRAEALRAMIRPFVLRRLKTDPDVLSDLPDLLETKEFATLTAEQARLYEQVVREMLSEVDRADGIQRRGLVLAGLVKLKQICNHPANLAKGAVADVSLDEEAEGDHAVSPGELRTVRSSRSGKTLRLMQMLEEILAGDNRALIFTQYRRMGHLLSSMIQHDLGVQPLFLHGGTARAKRQVLIDRFQSNDPTAAVFILSLRAGGVGLNLTAANHVFHFDRWWNPAVENQATDRAFRIGQRRNVHVHKLICSGTLEDRIDQMLEQKTELAERIIGAGEDWLTGLSTSQLRELLTLRDEALEEDR